MNRTLATFFAAVADAAVIALTVVSARTFMLGGMAVNAAGPQWGAERYWLAGCAAALLYALFAAITGMYSTNRQPDRVRLPLINLAMVATCLIFGLIVCGRFEHLFSGEQLLARRVLFLAAVAVYVATTVIHYWLSWLTRGASQHQHAHQEH